MLAASQRKRTARENKELHAKVLLETFDFVEKINSIDMFSLWWVEQALNERKTSFGCKDASLVSYNFWRSGAKQAAGMKMVVTPNPLKVLL